MQQILEIRQMHGQITIHGNSTLPHCWLMLSCAGINSFIHDTNRAVWTSYTPWSVLLQVLLQISSMAKFILWNHWLTSFKLSRRINNSLGLASSQSPIPRTDFSSLLKQLIGQQASTLGDVSAHTIQQHLHECQFQAHIPAQALYWTSGTIGFMELDLINDGQWRDRVSRL